MTLSVLQVNVAACREFPHKEIFGSEKCKIPDSLSPKKLKPGSPESCGDIRPFVLPPIIHSSLLGERLCPRRPERVLLQLQVRHPRGELGDLVQALVVQAARVQRKRAQAELLGLLGLADLGGKEMGGYVPVIGQSMETN